MNVYIKKQSFLWQKVLTGIGTLFIFIIFLNFFQYQIRNYFYVISSPIAKVFWRSGNTISVFSESFLHAKNLKQENSDLQQENQKLLSQISLLEGNLQQKQTVKEAMDIMKDSNFTILSTNVIGLDASNDVMVINRGSDDGISENMPVISSQKVIYGKVFKVYKNFSQVMLISNKNSVLNVKIQSDDPSTPPVFGATKGYGSLSFYLDLVNSDAKMKEGDVLVTSGLEGTFPSNLLVGKITSVSKNDLKPFQTAQVQPFFNPKDTDIVFVITNYTHQLK